MTTKWMPAVRVQVSGEDFVRIPRNPAYKYEYFSDTMWISPRPKFYHALLKFDEHTPIEAGPVAVRRLRADDWEGLVDVFVHAFYYHEPFSGALEEEKREAAVHSLTSTREGNDGPLIERACFVAEDAQGQLLGAVLITLAPPVNPESWAGLTWTEPPPEGCIERREGWAHLTWAFVDSYATCHGVGSALLRAAVGELREMGFEELLSTFMLGNWASTLWHWRQGFRLLGYPGSLRRFK